MMQLRKQHDATQTIPAAVGQPAEPASARQTNPHKVVWSRASQSNFTQITHVALSGSKRLFYLWENMALLCERSSFYDFIFAPCD